MHMYLCMSVRHLSTVLNVDIKSFTSIYICIYYHKLPPPHVSLPLSPRKEKLKILETTKGKNITQPNAVWQYTLQIYFNNTTEAPWVNILGKSKSF